MRALFRSGVSEVLLGSCLLIVLFAVAPASITAAVPDLHATAQAVDNHYNRLRSLQAEFTETYRGAGLEREESGTLWLKKPGKMRWEYRSPREKLFLSDGRQAWFYVPGDKQVRRTSVRKLDDLRSPLAFLLGKTKLEKELEGLSFAPDLTPSAPGNVILRGVPKGLGDRVAQVQLEVTPGFQLSRILLQEVDGGVTEYRFAGVRENLTIADSKFGFVPPAGVEVIDEQFGQ